MDKETRNTLVLGVFVTIGMILLVVAVYFIGSKRNLFSSTFHVYAAFSDVNGLQKGDNVRFRGITVGSVKSITVSSDSIIKVEMIVEQNMKQFIKRKALASIVTDGLMGNKIVIIRNIDSSSTVIAENDTLKTMHPIDLEDVTRKLRASNDNIVNITSNLSNITDKINKGKGPLGVLLMDTVLAKNIKESVRHIKESAKNIRKGSANINQETEALKHNFLFRRFFKKLEKEKKKNQGK